MNVNLRMFCFIFPFFVTKYTFFFYYEIVIIFVIIVVPVGFSVLNDTIQILWLLSAGWIVNCCTQSETRNPTGEPLLLSRNDVVQEFVSISSLRHI